MDKQQPYNGQERRETKNLSSQEKAAIDGQWLHGEAQKRYGRKIVTVGDVVDIDSRLRSDEERDSLRRAVAHIIRNPEQVEIDERLMALVVEPINALPENQRTIKGKVRSGEEVASAIPDVEAFLAEVNLQQKDGILLDFFELNGPGQLVMKDNCKEAYGLGENGLQARIRQTRVVYKEGGRTKVMTGEECFKVTEQNEEGEPLNMELSQAVKKIDPRSILMVRGLPALKKDDDDEPVGEYARMNKGQLERETSTWADDDSLVREDGSPDFSRARIASHWLEFGVVDSFVASSDTKRRTTGSRGVLRVNLNFES